MFFRVKTTLKYEKRIFENSSETLAMATKSRVGVFKKLKKTRKKRQKKLTFGRPRFWRLFETFWDGF